MSFILDALKKSEQQRQQNAEQQQVRNRTLSLSSPRSVRWLYFLLTGLMVLVIFFGWWLYRSMEATFAPPIVITPVVSTPPATKPPETAQPAPVPRDYAPAQAATVREGSSEQPLTAPKSRPVDAFTPATLRRASEPVATVVLQPAEPRAANKLPLYHELSRDLRDRMSPLTISLHFYAKEPARRLVRINGRLLREGDLVEQDLRLVAITPTGATLDYLGKLFEMLNP